MSEVISLNLSKEQAARLTLMMDGLWLYSNDTEDRKLADYIVRALAPMPENKPNTWQALHHSLGDLGKASVMLPNGQPTKVHVEIGPHVEFVHMRARGSWWLYATPDHEESETIAFCLEHEETTDIPIAFDVAVTWTGDLETDLATYNRETTKALAKALKALDNNPQT